MKLRTAFVFLLIVATLLSGCGKDERIEGKVQDIFGNPLKDVNVKIKTSTFSSITDESGSYSLDYVPGSMKLLFSKDGYTTRSLDLNIQQKTYFPAETLTLYPIPQENGIFYVDTGNKRLIKIEENGRIESHPTQNAQKYSFFDLRRSYVVNFFKPNLTIKAGKAMFIDRTHHKKIMPTTVREDGIIYEGERGPFGEAMGEYYSGFLQDSTSLIGEENLLIRLIELGPGTYAWIPLLREKEVAFGFQVVNPAAKESKLSGNSTSKSKEAQPLQQSEEIRTPVTREPLKHSNQEVKVKTEDQQTIQAPIVPIHTQGDTYTLESISLDSGTRNTTERKIILANSEKLVTPVNP